MFTLQEIYDSLIADLGDEDFDPFGTGQRERIWEALQLAKAIGAGYPEKVDWAGNPVTEEEEIA